MRRDVLWLALIVSLAVVVRIVWVLRANTAPFNGLDTYFYDHTARSLARGLGYTNPADGQPTALFPPGYSFALAGVYKLLWPSLAIGQAFTVATAAAVAVATYVLGRVAIGRNVAIVGGLLWAIFPSQVFWTSLIMPETMFTLGLLLSLLLVMASDRPASTRGRMLVLTAAGVFAGAALLMRGQALGLCLVVGLWLAWHRRRDALLGTAVFTAAMLLMLLPWTLRNMRELDAPVLVSTNIGWNAVIGHDDNATGGFWSPVAAHTFDKYLAPNPKGEVDRNKAGLRMAWRWARSHPRQEIVLTMKKTAILWNTDDDAIYWQQIGRVPDYMGQREYNSYRYLCDVFYYVVLVLAGIGVVAGIRQHQRWASLWVLIVLYWTAFHLLFFSENRYHYPLAPLLALAAAAGAFQVTSWARQAAAGRLAPTRPQTS